MHCTENHILFFKYSEKIVFPKKSHWNMTFLVLFLYYDVSFSWKYDLILSTDTFLQMFSKDSLSKKIALKYDFSCIIREDVSFSQKYDIILWTENFLKMFWKVDIFKKLVRKYDTSWIIRKWYFFSGKYDFIL